MKRIISNSCAAWRSRHHTLGPSPRTIKAKLDERLTSAQAVINEIMATPDKGIPQRHPRGRILRRRHPGL